MNTIVPMIGKVYKVISGCYVGFQGECISYDMNSDLPIILQDGKWNSRAVKIDEVELIDSNQSDISRDQKN